MQLEKLRENLTVENYMHILFYFPFKLETTYVMESKENTKSELLGKAEVLALKL